MVKIERPGDTWRMRRAILGDHSVQTLGARIGHSSAPIAERFSHDIPHLPFSARRHRGRYFDRLQERAAPAVPWCRSRPADHRAHPPPEAWRRQHFRYLPAPRAPGPTLLRLYTLPGYLPDYGQ